MIPRSFPWHEKKMCVKKNTVWSVVLWTMVSSTSRSNQARSGSPESQAPSNRVNENRREARPGDGNLTRPRPVAVPQPSGSGLRPRAIVSSLFPFPAAQGPPKLPDEAGDTRGPAAARVRPKQQKSVLTRRQPLKQRFRLPLLRSSGTVPSNSNETRAYWLFAPRRDVAWQADHSAVHGRNPRRPDQDQSCRSDVKCPDHKYSKFYVSGGDGQGWFGTDHGKKPPERSAVVSPGLFAPAQRPRIITYQLSLSPILPRPVRGSSSWFHLKASRPYHLPVINRRIIRRPDRTILASPMQKQSRKTSRDASRGQVGHLTLTACARDMAVEIPSPRADPAAGIGLSCGVGDGMRSPCHKHT